MLEIIAIILFFLLMLGYVRAETEVNLALDVARNVKGKASVKSDMQVKDRRPVVLPT